jgi:hypothetical protein
MDVPTVIILVIVYRRWSYQPVTARVTLPILYSLSSANSFPTSQSFIVIGLWYYQGRSIPSRSFN